jgi:hypothetical protein
LFEKRGNEAAVGEASPSYLYDESAPCAVKDAIPECRIVMILRNPVERLFSDFFYSRSWGSNLDMEFSSFVTACIDGEGAGRQGFAPALMAKKGLYAGQVRRYLDVFTPDDVFMRLHEDLQLEPGRLMSELYGFLGVDSSFIPKLRRVHNANSEAVFPVLSRIVRRSRRLETLFVNPVLPSSRKGFITNTVLALNRRKEIKKETSRDMKREDRERLLAYYRSSTEELQQLIGRDLRHWLV